MKPKEKNFKTKIGSGPVIFLCIIFTVLCIISLYSGEYRILFMTLPLALLVSYTIFSIRYDVISDQLVIRSGFFYTLKIQISSIRKIEETWGVIASAATSTDRLELIYNKFDSIMISPKDKTGFIDALKEINPEIDVKRKN